MQKTSLNAILMGSLVFSGLALASDYTIPNTFTSGSAAVAADVNANFSAAKTAIDDNNAQIQTKQNRVSSSCTAGSSIRVINSDGTVTCETDDNAGGDITGVTAGSGLTGGGASGSVTLNIGTGAVTSAHIADGNVTSTDIANNSVTSIDMQNEPGIDWGGIASSYNSEVCDSGTDHTISSVSISAPSSGYIFVSASGRVRTTSTTGGYIFTGLGTNPNGISAGEYNWQYHYYEGGYWDQFQYQMVASVSAGTYTYYLKACESVSTVTGSVNTRPLIATFFPTRY